MFDPEAARKRKAGPRRGMRLRALLGVAAIIVVPGLIGLQKWWSSGKAAVKQDLVVEATYTAPPKYEFKPEPVQVVAALPVQPPESVPQAPQSPEPDTFPMQHPPRQVPQQQRPRRVSFDVTPPPQDEQGDWFADGRRPMLAKGCALRPGASLIPAVLNSVINSEVPGQIIATVSENVYDADGIGRVLVPQGTKLVGLYKSDLTLGSRRLGMVWTELTMPNGKQLALADANGMDVAGSMAVGGTVSTAWMQVVLTAAVFSLIDAAQMSAVPDDNAYASALANSTINQFSRTTQQIVGKMLDQAVKIRIPSGTPILVSVGKTVRVC